MPRIHSVPAETDIEAGLTTKNCRDELLYRVARENPSQLSLYVEGVASYHAQRTEVRFVLEVAKQGALQTLSVSLDANCQVKCNTPCKGWLR